MAAHQSAVGFFYLRPAAAQDRSDHFRGHNVGWNAQEVQSSERAAAHRVNIRQGIGSSDLTVQKRIVHDRRKKIHRLNQSAVAIDAVDSSVIGAGCADQQIGITHLW